MEKYHTEADDSQPWISTAAGIVTITIILVVIVVAAITITFVICYKIRHPSRFEILSSAKISDVLLGLFVVCYKITHPSMFKILSSAT